MYFNKSRVFFITLGLIGLDIFDVRKTKTQRNLVRGFVQLLAKLPSRWPLLSLWPGAGLAIVKLKRLFG